jgi:hypothetical protein
VFRKQTVFEEERWLRQLYKEKSGNNHDPDTFEQLHHFSRLVREWISKRREQLLNITSLGKRILERETPDWSTTIKAVWQFVIAFADKNLYSPPAIPSEISSSEQALHALDSLANWCRKLTNAKHYSVLPIHMHDSVAECGGQVEEDNNIQQRTEQLMDSLQLLPQSPDLKREERLKEIDTLTRQGILWLRVIKTILNTQDPEILSKEIVDLRQHLLSAQTLEQKALAYWISESPIEWEPTCSGTLPAITKTIRRMVCSAAAVTETSWEDEQLGAKIREHVSLFVLFLEKLFPQFDAERIETDLRREASYLKKTSIDVIPNLFWDDGGWLQVQIESYERLPFQWVTLSPDQRKTALLEMVAGNNKVTPKKISSTDKQPDQLDLPNWVSLHFRAKQFTLLNLLWGRNWVTFDEVVKELRYRRKDPLDAIRKLVTRTNQNLQTHRNKIGDSWEISEMNRENQLSWRLHLVDE